MAAREVDDLDNPINAIVSVLMLREGWDVQNVTVVVGLRPYSSKANILPEQTIGRGLRLMFRGVATDYVERVDVIGNEAFIQFVEQLEKDEDIALDTFQVGKDRLAITTIMPDPAKMDKDIAIPTLSPILTRKRTLAEEIAGLDVAAMSCPTLPRKAGDAVAQTFRYEGYDIISLQKLIEREYTLPEAQTPQEVISYYAKRIAQDVRLPSQFAALAPKVREFLETRAFGEPVNIEYTDSNNNLHYYEPDFVAVTAGGVHYLVETKGREDVDVANKDRAATLWCENATRLTSTHWRYLKVPQKEFEKLQPDEFSDVLVFAQTPVPW